ncbi:phosphonate metabolism transcriptional regulator PhnF [Hyphomonas atlantica corrig.]|uniref:phosphonate metabolism transcriptional regulator PhnF n=1 Tax=Hyphomonas atlantica TaxID=1280948 RepID=UPI002353EBC8|nr:phosphonate metabolism transcriptional regulator PhnF [Hyphomonas atlantica]
MANRIWERVSSQIEESIRKSEYAPGDKLPTEAEFSRKFMVNRHTLRRALSHLQEIGLIESTQGRGSYVRRPAIRYTIGKRTRFSDQITNQSISASTKTRQVIVKPASRDVAKALEVPLGSKVIAVSRIGYAGDIAISMAAHHFDFHRFPTFQKVYPDHRSITQTLIHCGVLDFTRKWTVVRSRLPGPEECAQLNIPKHVPLILTKSLNVDPLGKPLEYGEAVFASDRMELDIAPTEEPPEDY